MRERRDEGTGGGREGGEVEVVWGEDEEEGEEEEVAEEEADDEAEVEAEGVEEDG